MEILADLLRACGAAILLSYPVGFGLAIYRWTVPEPETPASRHFNRWHQQDDDR